MKASVRIQSDDFSQDEEIAALKASSRRMGGIATFVGCARDFSEGREVSQISFDAYGSMAVSEMKQLRSEAIDRFGLLDARIVHRICTVTAGDNIVFIAILAGRLPEARQAAVDADEHLLRHLLGLTDERLAEDRDGQAKDPIPMALE